MTYEEIKKANESISPTELKNEKTGKKIGDYVEVNQRIKAFRMVCPNGTITTEIISLDNGVVTMKSTVLDEDGKILGSGYAQEKESSSYINRTSFIENCETSAVGRALGMCGFGIDVSIASAEEVINATNNQKEQLSEEVLEEAKVLGIELDKVATYLKKPVEEITEEELKECIKRKKKAVGGKDANI